MGGLTITVVARGRIWGDFVWLMGGRLGSLMASGLALAIMARLLTHREFGVVAAAMIAINLSNSIFESSFGLNLLRRNCTRIEDVRTTLTVVLVFSICACLALILAAPVIEAFFGFAHVGSVLAALAICIPMRCIFAVATSQLQLAGRFRIMARAALASTCFGSFLVGVPLAFLGFGVWAPTAATIATSALEMTMLTASATLPVRPLIERAALRELAAVSVFNFAALFDWLASGGVLAIVGRALGAASLGIYSRSWKLLDMFISATAAQMTRVFIPLYSRSRQEPRAVRQAFEGVLEMAFPVYAVVAALMALNASLVVAIVLGDQWRATVPVVQILFISIFPRCITKAFEDFAVANGAIPAAVARQGLFAGCVVAGAFLTVLSGLVAVAAATLVAASINYLVSMDYARRIAGLDWRFLAILHVRTIGLVGGLWLLDWSVAGILTGHESRSVVRMVSVCAALLGLSVLLATAPASILGPRHAADLRRAWQALRQKSFAQLRCAVARW